MSEYDFVQLIKDIGFPIAVVLWFMFRTEKILKQNTEAITELKSTLVALAGR